MGKNLVVQLNDLEGSECTLILFNGQHWRIRKGKAYRYSVMYIDGKPQEVTFDVSTIQKLYANIQQVKDERQRADETTVPEPKPETTPNDPLVPNPPVNPDYPTNPDTPTTPETPDKPVDPKTPDDSLTKMVNQSKEQLGKSSEGVSQINKKLHEIKSELNNLKNIDQNTLTLSEKAGSQWSKVEQLVSEYNQLSGQLKQMLDKDGTIEGINVELYGQTYNTLNQKVTEIKKEQKNAQNVTNVMNGNIEKAQDTANNLENKAVDYENAQADVQKATTEGQNAVNEASQNPSVQVAVQPEINQVNAKLEGLNQVNTATKATLNEVSNQDNQLYIDAAQQTATSINEKADLANQAVTNVTDDFASLPQSPEVSTTNDSTSIAPVDQTQQTPVDSSNQEMNTVASSINAVDQTATNQVVTAQ